MQIGTPSHDQILIFLSVVETGSFNAAAKRLGRANSAISYGISGLEAQLGQVLFAREGSRKPVLTVAGKAVLAHARAVAEDMDALRAKMRSFAQGLESSVTMAIDVMYPIAALAHVLRDFAQAHPTVDPVLRVEALGAVMTLVESGTADFGLAGPMLTAPAALDQRAIGAVMLLPVAAPFHPLAVSAAIQPGEARRHIQIVLTDRSSLTEGQDFSVLGLRSWRLADLGAKHALLLQGIGWGYMPAHQVQGDLAAGRLKHLMIPEGSQILYPLTAVWRRDTPPGPARQWLLDQLREACVSAERAVQ